MSTSRIIDSPLGYLQLTASNGQLASVTFLPRSMPDDGSNVEPEDGWVLREAAGQLSEYFQGSRRQFELPLLLQGTEFQDAVWTAIQDIPWGSTTSYQELAEQLGETAGSARAVGQACGANPIPIVVPCHRVVGSDGNLRGYTGGVGRKR